MPDTLAHWIAQFGYILVALFLVVEGAGLPVPGETALVTAAALAGIGRMSVVGVALSACVGTITGGMAGYWLGARGGTALVARHGKWIRLTPERLSRTHAFFARHGAKTVVVGRFIAVVRSFVGIVAGISSMSFRTFAIYNAIGGVVWVAVFTTLGYVFGRNLPRLERYIGTVSLLLAILIAVVFVVVWLWRWFRRNRGEVVAQLNAVWDQLTESPRASSIRERYPRAWELIGGRFRRGEYLALHLMAGFVLSLVVIAVFASITEGLVDTSPLVRFDLIVAARLRLSLAPDSLHSLAIVSGLGGRGTMTLLLAVGGAVYALRGRGVELSGWIAAFLGAAGLDTALRAAVRRSELPFADLVLAGWGHGIVSGHVLGAVVGWGMIAYLGGALTRRNAARTLFAVLAVCIVASITIARLYLGQHYVSDASAGLAAGLLWLATCISGVEIARPPDGGSA